MKYILMDVEGTTTSLSFVHDVLFPYSLKELENFLKARPDLVIGERSDFIAQLRAWILEDKKEPILKSIQGEIWKQGFESGEIIGHVYPDVPLAFVRWRGQGLALGIYSSGSVLAQQQLFGHTQYGDLNPHLSHNFDTEVGGKRENSSYQEIVRRLGLPAAEVLFISDVAQELQAAQDAGLTVVQALRQGVTPASAFKQVADFSSISY